MDRAGHDVFPNTAWPVLLKIAPLVDHQGINACHPWLGSRNGKGYPQIIINGKTIAVHRVMYASTHNDDPGPNMVRHLCGNSWCCNPNHLATGTQEDNEADKKLHGTNQHRRLPDELVVSIKELRSQGVHRAKVAEMFATSPNVIRAIDERRAYPHVEGPAPHDGRKRKEPKPERVLQPWELLTDDDGHAIRQAYADGTLRPELKQQYGIGDKTLKDILNAKGRWSHLGEPIKPPANALSRSGNNHFANLSVEAVLDMVAMDRDGSKTKDIADKHGCSNRNVRDVLTGRRWSNVTGIGR